MRFIAAYIFVQALVTENSTHIITAIFNAYFWVTKSAEE